MSTDHNLSEDKGEPKRNRTEVLGLTSLTPYRGAKPADMSHPFGLVVLVGLKCLLKLDELLLRQPSSGCSANLKQVWRTWFVL